MWLTACQTTAKLMWLDRDAARGISVSWMRIAVCLENARRAQSLPYLSMRHGLAGSLDHNDVWPELYPQLRSPRHVVMSRPSPENLTALAVVRESWMYLPHPVG